MIVNACYNSTEPNIGLKLNMERKTLKCYMADTGLLISHAFDENGIVSEEIYKKLLFDKLSVNNGMLMENMVAQMLTAAGHRLYFFSKSSRENADDRMEIDFLIAKSKATNKHNISPIEVKSGDRYTLSSINKFRKKKAAYRRPFPTLCRPLVTFVCCVDRMFYGQQIQPCAFNVTFRFAVFQVVGEHCANDVYFSPL